MKCHSNASGGAFCATVAPSATLAHPLARRMRLGALRKGRAERNLGTGTTGWRAAPKRIFKKFSPVPPIWPTAVAKKLAGLAGFLPS